jgi:hypothetical protein
VIVVQPSFRVRNGRLMRLVLTFQLLFIKFDLAFNSLLAATIFVFKEDVHRRACKRDFQRSKRCL